MINLLPNKATIALIIIGFLAGIMIVAYLLGAHHQSVKDEQQIIRDTVNILRTRGKLRNEINADDARAMCKRFGLSDEDERECVRCVGEPDPKNADGCLYNPK